MAEYDPTNFPHALAFVESPELVPVTCWRVDVDGRLRRQPRLAELFKDIACEVCYVNFEQKHVLLNPPFTQTITEWMDYARQEYVGMCNNVLGLFFQASGKGGGNTIPSKVQHYGTIELVWWTPKPNAGIDLQLIPPELWTKWEKKRFLEDFYEHHIELTGDRIGVTAVFKEDTHAFVWKGSLKKCADFASRFEDDTGPVFYLDAFQEMMHFWRNMMQHYNEIWILNKKRGKWEYDSPKSKSECKERIEVMLQLEKYFPFAKTSYKCVIRGYEVKKYSITKNLKLTDQQKPPLLVEPARYIKRFSIMAPLDSAEYGGYRAFI